MTARLKIWHIGGDSAVDCVNGVNTIVWSVARSQAAAGHAVTVIVPSAPNEITETMARAEHLTLFVAPRSKWPVLGELRRLLATEQPDIVHMHSVFIPQHAALAKALAAAGIPYIVTSHGGLSAVVMKRGKLKKTIYGLLLEKPRFMRAAALTVSNPLEVDDVRGYVPGYRGPIQFVFNSVEVGAPRTMNSATSAEPGRKNIVFLGRLDVLHKGIDRLVEIARHHPEADYRLYGAEDAKTKPWLDSLKQNQPANLSFHAPVFGDDKRKVLSNADLYIQPSRWEGFPLAVAEAMALGVPCAISETLGMTELFRENELALILEKDPVRAAGGIRRLLADRPALAALGERCHAFALAHFRLSVVAETYVDLYRRAIASKGKTSVTNSKRDLAGTVLADPNVPFREGQNCVR